MSEEKKSLVTLLFEEKTLIEMLIDSGGEMDHEIEERINQLEVDVPRKIDGTCYMVDQLRATETKLKEQRDRYSKAVASCANAVEAFKRRLLFVMETSDKPELLGEERTIKTAKTPPALVIDENVELPEEYLKKEVVTTIDKAAIKEALKRGATIPGTRLEVKGTVRFGIRK